MTKISRSQKILSEIELFLEAGKYEDARVLLTFLDHDPFDRESRLRLLMINVALDGPGAYKDDIAQLPTSSDLSDLEKELIEKIFFLARKPAEEKGRKDRSPVDRSSPPLDQSGAYQAIESQLRDKVKLLQDREAELLAFKETLRSLEQQLSEEKELLESRNADLQALGSRVTELTAQLDALNLAKDQEVRLLHEEIARRAELFQAKESATAHLQDRVAEQIRVLDTQLGETKNLLTARDAELDSFNARVSALIQEKAELISEREKADRAIQEGRREQAGLVQAAESSIAKMEEQMGEQIRSLELQLGEKQSLLESSRTEPDELRSQLCFLNQRVAEAEAAKLQAETLLQEERSRASRIFLATHSSDDRPAGERAGVPEAIDSASSAGRNYSFSRLKRLRRTSPINWKAKTFSAAALPVAAAGLLLLPIGYFLLGDARTVSNPNTPVRWEGTFEPPDVAEKARLPISVSKTSADDEDRSERGRTTPRLVEQRARKTVVPDSRNAKKGEGRPERVAGYVTRRTVTLREQPRYAATAKAEIGPGTAVSVLATQGNWLRVKSGQSGAIGYVRKEYLVYASSTR